MQILRQNNKVKKIIENFDNHYLLKLVDYRNDVLFTSSSPSSQPFSPPSFQPSSLACSYLSPTCIYA
jgi:hypothetical protein